jgi:hypothetical protein
VCHRVLQFWKYAQDSAATGSARQIYGSILLQTP